MRPRPLAGRTARIALAIAFSLPATAGAAPVACTGDPGLDETINGEKCPKWVALDPRVGSGAGGGIVDMISGDDLVFAAGSAAGTDNPYAPEILVAANDRETGLPAWKYQVASDEPGWTEDLALAGDALAVVGVQRGTYLDPPQARDDLFAAVLEPQTGEQRWVSRLEEAAAYAVAFGVGDGRVYVAGNEGHDDEATPLVVAYDAQTGEVLWHEAYEGLAGAPARASGIEVDPSGERLYVTIERQSPQAAGISLALEAASGQALWSYEHAGPVEQSVLAPDGASLYTLGAPVGSDEDVWLAALDTADIPQGQQRVERWHRVLGPRVYHAPRPLAIDPDGERVYLTGIEHSNIVGDARFDGTEAYSTEDGTPLWSQSLGLDLVYHGQMARDLAPSTDGMLYVAGGAAPRWTSSGFAHQFVTAAYDAVTGERLWVATYTSQTLPPPFIGRDFATSVAVHPDGGDVYTGGTFSNGAAAGRAVIAYDTDA